MIFIHIWGWHERDKKMMMIMRKSFSWWWWCWWWEMKVWWSHVHETETIIYWRRLSLLPDPSHIIRIVIFVLVTMTMMPMKMMTMKMMTMVTIKMTLTMTLTMTMATTMMLRILIGWEATGGSKLGSNSSQEWTLEVIFGQKALGYKDSKDLQWSKVQRVSLLTLTCLMPGTRSTGFPWGLSL